MTIRPLPFSPTHGDAASYTALVSCFEVLPATVGQVITGPFGIYMATDGDDDSSQEMRISVARALILQGCRRFWFCGPAADFWEDAADHAAVGMYEMASRGTAVLSHDLYMMHGDSGGISTVSATLQEVIHFFRYDNVLPPFGPLTGRVFATRSAELEERVLNIFNETSQ